MLKLAHLPERAVVAVTGPDRVTFLQGLVSNDVALAAPGKAVWAALLTAQGKWLADFFILSVSDGPDGGRLLLDCERAQAAMLVQRLSRYRLRADVALRQIDLHVHVAWDTEAREAHAMVEPGSIAAPDPRHPDAGWRILSPTEREWEADESDWDRHRLLLGLPEGARDCESEKTVLLEAGFDELHGISWTKGCYMGQELTARTRYRGLLKRRLVPVTSEAALPAPGTPITHDGLEVGTMRSSRDALGIALLRLEHLHGDLRAGGHALRTRIPDWMRLPAETA
ncbi:CAF17-like 4Fe-4S cluster assembly/insertion protein YgfZ [Lichenicoccus roseus]|uniref:Folate-binding protein YgfZ n=1 Tax=Lichenicoccus roseus TaxID=2683649 RepID=A0A5R9JB49_9PROT|nr:folate-binding protein YgfZ [Lichenicoccus roseus]TLU72841.1 folate-binding protein YgfZ [Lichenicoccus roseus]